MRLATVADAVICAIVISMSAPASTQTRPGGRSTRVRADVHRATLELLAEHPSETLTLPVIAARAGVHPTTLYRRWGSIGELLTDVASSRFSADRGAHQRQRVGVGAGGHD